MKETYIPKNKDFWETYGFYEDELLDRSEVIKLTQDNIIKSLGIEPENVPIVKEATIFKFKKD